MLQENLREGVVTGIFLSFIIGIIVSWILKPTFSSTIFILSLALLPGFFIMTLIYIYKTSKEKIAKTTSRKYDWGIEVNLKKLQIIHNRYASMIQSSSIIAIGSFISMVFIAKDFPAWNTGHEIFFPIATAIFILSLHFIVRWWILMREDYKHLQFNKLEKN